MAPSVGLGRGILQEEDESPYPSATPILLGRRDPSKRPGVDVVFAAGVLDAGAGQLVGVAFVVDSKIEDYDKETIRQICQTIRVGEDLSAKKTGSVEGTRQAEMSRDRSPEWAMSILAIEGIVCDRGRPASEAGGDLYPYSSRG